MRFISVAWCVWLCFGASATEASDVNKIERKLVKEPAYSSATPTYCLLVVGREASQVIWLVHDGDELFVDLNGNGNLTESGESFKPESSTAECIRFQVDLPSRGKEKSTLYVAFYKVQAGSEEKNRWEAILTLILPSGRSFGAWGDETGSLFFSSTLQKAPIIHMDGPLQMGFECPYPLRKKAKDLYELNVGVGTRGVGVGTFGHLKYGNTVPVGVHPMATLEFPGPTPSGSPVRVKVPLKQRC